MVVQVFYILVLKKTVATWGLTSKMSSASATTTSHLVGHATNLWSFLRCSGCIHPPFFSDFISVWLCAELRDYSGNHSPYHTILQIALHISAYLYLILFVCVCLWIDIGRFFWQVLNDLHPVSSSSPRARWHWRRRPNVISLADLGVLGQVATWLLQKQDHVTYSPGTQITSILHG